MFGVTRSAVSQWESDQTRPSTSKLSELSKVLNVSYEWLASGRGSKKLQEINSDREAIKVEDSIGDYIGQAEILDDLFNIIRRMPANKQLALWNLLKR